MKIGNQTNGSTISHGNGLVIGSWVPDSLVGCVLEIVEAIGMPEKQEISIKNLIKDAIYKKVSDSENNAVFIEADLHDAIRAIKRERPLENVNLERLK